MLSIAHSDCFIFDKVIHISVKAPSITFALSIGSLNGKNCLSKGPPRFLSIFPFEIFELNQSFSVDVQNICTLNLIF